MQQSKINRSGIILLQQSEGIRESTDMTVLNADIEMNAHDNFHFPKLDVVDNH